MSRTLSTYIVTLFLAIRSKYRHFYSLLRNAVTSLFILNRVILQSENAMWLCIFYPETFSKANKDFHLPTVVQNWTLTLLRLKAISLCSKRKVFYVVFGCNLFVKTCEKEKGITVYCVGEREMRTLNLRSHRWCSSCTGAGDFRIQFC